MTLYRKDKFEVTEEEIITKKICEVEIDQYGIVITTSDFPDKSIYLEKKHFDEVIDKWNLFHTNKLIKKG